MSSLTIEMGLRRRRGNSPTMPDQLAGRDDVTLAQKQRLAMLAKMGVGPIAGAVPSEGGRRLSSSQAIEMTPGPPMPDRRALLLEKERRFREQQEREQELEEQAALARQAKNKKRAGGMARLGPVMPREDEVPQFPPAPAQVPTPRGPWENDGAPVRPRPTGMMQVKIPQDMAERTKAPEPEKEESSSEDEKDDGADALARDVLAQIAAQKRAMAVKAEKRKQEEERKKQGKKKKRKRDRDDNVQEQREDDDAYDEDDDASDDAGYERLRRDSASSKPMPMVVDCVKGKVSLDNKNFTDADLERRFQQQESSRSTAGLMTEEQVLKMIQKEKKTQGPAGSASRRVQRELAEWAAAKEQQRQRVKSPHRFERMVVSRK